MTWKDIGKAGSEPALSAAEPVMFVSEKQLQQCVGHYVPSRKTAEGNFQLALYRAPPAPSVAVNALDDLVLPIAGTLFVARGAASARAYQEMVPHGDGYFYLVKIEDVAKALEPFRSALSAQVQDVAGWKLVPAEPTAEMEDAARHLMMWLDFARPTEAALIAHCKRLGKEPPPECRDVDHVPPKAMRLFWVYRAMLAAAPAKQEG